MIFDCPCPPHGLGVQLYIYLIYVPVVVAYLSSPSMAGGE